MTWSNISTSSTKFVFWPISKTKMTALAFDWLRHFWPLCNHWSEFNETWQEVFFRADRKTRKADLVFDSLRHFRIFCTDEQYSRKLDKNKDLSVLQYAWIFQINWKQTWPPWPLNYFDFSATAEMSLTKLDCKEKLNITLQNSHFSDFLKTKMAVLAYDLLSHFRLLCNHWTGFIETWH